MKVYVLTTCRNRERLYGATLVFDTIRVGLPTAEVVCVDNGSQVGRAEIEQAARAAGCEFVQLEQQHIHANYLETVLIKNQQASGPLVFLDPDVIFWGSIEGFAFAADVLVAGRLVPEAHTSRGVTAARLHPSLLWIPHPGALLERCFAIRRELWDFRPFHPFAFVENGVRRHFDTAAALTSCLEPHEMKAFEEPHLDCYDHLFIGTAIDWVKRALAPETARWIESVHERAQSAPATLRGLWREQDQMWDRL